jgi:toxin ParE1/3/4
VKVIVREAAGADLQRIYQWIEKDSPDNARSVVERILDAIENNIPAFPYIGRIGKADGTREWMVRKLPYIIVYSVDDAREAVTILAIAHGAQNR